MNWTAEQQALFKVDTDGRLQLPRVAVTADAGSGKTSVLSERVRTFLASKHHQQRRILCVSFTEKSAADLESKLSQWLNAEVYTIHGFCARVVQEFGGLLKLSPIFRILDQDETLDLFFQSFQKVYRRIPPKITDHSGRTIFGLCFLAQEKKIDLPIRTIDQSFKELEHFTHEVLAEFKILKTSIRVMDYTDLEFKAYELLKQPFVTHTLQKRYGHVFVDEFQDTSFVQCQLIESLVGPKGYLFVVGDFKQSIYRFRGADVKVFHGFIKKLPEQRRLSTNFRSYSEIIDAVNRVCIPILPEYQHMHVGRMIDEKKTKLPLPCVSRVEAPSESEGISQILRFIKTKGIDWSQVVLLLPRIRGNEKILRELSRQGVGLALTSSGDGSLEPGFMKLVNLWIWACEPWLKLRASQVLTDFSVDDVRHQFAEKIEALQSPYQPQMSCEQLLHALGQQFELYQKLGIVFSQFSQFILSHQNEGLLPPVLGRRLSRLTQGQMFGGAVNSMSTNQILLLPPPPEFQGILRVMTIHAAKGLEFPVVILADLKSRYPRVEGALVTNEEGIWVAGRDDAGKLLKWDGFMQAVHQEVQAQKEESARLLYVAMTRARDALFIVDSLTEDSEAKPSLWQQWVRAGIPESVLLPTDQTLQTNQANGSEFFSRSISLEKDPPLYTRARIGVTDYASTMMAKEGFKARVSGGTKSFLVDDSVLAKDIGITVHQYLEHEAWEELKTYASSTHLDLSHFFAWLSSEMGKRIFGSFSERLRTEREFAFEWNHGKEVIVGQIDRLVIFEKEAWVIDYKVLMHSQDEKKRSQEDLLSTYSLQLKIYAQAIQQLLPTLSVRAFILDVNFATGQIWHEINL